MVVRATGGPVAVRTEAQVEHAVVMQVKFAEDTDPDAQMRMLNDLVVPHAKSQPGFQRGTWMHEGTQMGLGVVVFDTAEAAAAAKEVLKPPPGGPELVSSEVFEVGAHV